jgi:hypothetical protein
MVLTLDSVKATYKALGYPWHPVFNIGAFRASEQFTNEWDDLIFYCLNLPDGQVEFKPFNGTTDPGFQKHGSAIPEGTATMKAGFYKGLYAFGFHQGKKDHPCLKQVKTATYYRMKDGKQFDPSTICSGIFGTNLHSTKEGFVPDDVDNWSKGCIVVQRWASFEKLLDAAEKSLLKSFDFALITERQLVG